MKKTFSKIFLVASLSFISLSFALPNRVEVANEFACQYGQCNATAKSTGNRCKHCVSNKGDLYCYQHK